MDRIRNAVTRARSEREKTSPAEREPSPGLEALAARVHSEPSQDEIEFTPVKCDFDSFSKHRIIANEQDPVLNAYRVLRTRVLQKMEANNWRTLAVVSPGSGAGKTVTAINLAIAIGSKTGSRATLIDLDFYRPSIAQYLGLKEFPSVLDYFEGKRELQEIALRPELPDVLVLANERVSRRGAEHLTSPRADKMIDTAVNTFASRVVIFDMSPLLGCDDTIAFLPKVDCALLVASSGDTRVEELKEARRALSQTNILGTVLNKAPSAFLPNQYY